MSTNKSAAITAAQALLSQPYNSEFSVIYCELLELVVGRAPTPVPPVAPVVSKKVGKKGGKKPAPVAKPVAPVAAEATGAPWPESAAAPAPVSDQAAERKRKNAAKMAQYREKKRASEGAPVVVA